MSFDEKVFLELYEKKLGDKEIAEKLDIKRWKVRDLRKKYGLSSHTKMGGQEIKYSEEERSLIFNMHSKGFSIKSIAKEVGANYQTFLKFCKREELDTSLDRRAVNRIHLRNDKIFNYLDEHGPTSLRMLSTKLGISQHTFRKFLRVFYDEVESIDFKVGSRGKARTRRADIYGELSKDRIFILLRGDPRLIDFVANRIVFEVKSGGDAAIIMHHLSQKLGKERAKEIIEKLGYEYPSPNKQTRKFTDEQLLKYYKAKLNDVEIAKKLGVTPPAIRYRRRLLDLPVNR